MNKILLALFLLALVVPAVAQETIIYKTAPTLEWSAVTVDIDGKPLLPEDVVSYRVYLWDTAGGDIAVQPIGSLTAYQTVTTTSVAITFPYRANWACAVIAQLEDGDGNLFVSAPAYTTQAIPVTATGPFVYAPLTLSLPSVRGLRDVVTP